MVLRPDQAAADRAVNFINLLPHVKGQWAGKPFELRPWQEHGIIRPLFGTLDPDGARAHRIAYVSLPRKNGKSEIGAAVALKLLVDDNEFGAEVYSAAADRDQAGIVFNIAAQMVRLQPALRRRLKIIDSQKRIIYPATGSFYHAVSSDAFTKHGYNAHGVIFDELHAQPNRDLWDVLTTSGGSRRQPLTFAITTAGYDRNSICWEQYDYAKKILDGLIEDPRYFAYIREVPEGVDWLDRDAWLKANPAAGDFRSLDEMESLAKRAIEIPALVNTFRRLYLNQWTEQATKWLDMIAWDECADPIDLPSFAGRPCYAGLDLASTTDIAACVLVFPPIAPDECYTLIPFFWIPDEGMRERGRKDRVPYELWASQGFIEPTPGNIVDYSFIRERLLSDLTKRFKIQEVVFDPWNAAHVIPQIQEARIPCVEIRQGYRSMSAPTKEAQRMVLARKIRHGGNPVLRWMADNLMVSQDPAGNLKPDRAKSREKIDGMVAFIMALSRAMLHAKHVTPTVYSL